MFVQIGKILKSAGDAMSINIVSAGDGRLTVTLIPKGEWKNAALSAGLSVQATAEELDAGLVEQIEKWLGKRQSLAEQVESTLSVLAAAEAESKGKASDAIKKAAAAPKGDGVKVGTGASVATPAAAKQAAPVDVAAAGDTVNLFDA